MVLRWLALAVGGAHAQHALFQVPVPARWPSAFLPGTHVEVPGPAAIVSAAAEIPGAQLTGTLWNTRVSPLFEAAYVPQAEEEGSSSWVSWSLFAAAAVAGTGAILHAQTARATTRDTVADQLLEGFVQHEVSAADALSRGRTLATLALKGSAANSIPPKFPMHHLRSAQPWRISDDSENFDAKSTGSEEPLETPVKEAMLAVAGADETEEFDGEAYCRTLPGGFALAGFPGVRGFGTGFFDPWRFCSQEGITKGKVNFFREAELKHGRVGMLAALGFVVGENFHPLFGGQINSPSLVAFQETPLQTFWPAVVASLSILEVFSIRKFNEPDMGESWTIKEGEVPGDYGFDPLGLKPTDPDDFYEMQNLELSTGRLGMIGAIGMIVQELKTGEKLF